VIVHDPFDAAARKSIARRPVSNDMLLRVFGPA
jgi:hypothetical protein